VQISARQDKDRRQNFPCRRESQLATLTGEWLAYGAVWSFSIAASLVFKLAGVHYLHGDCRANL
jgi:hypothetical protein